MLYRHPFGAMGCDMLAVLAGPGEETTHELERVPVWFEEWEQALSRFRLDSELSRLNRTTDQPVPVSGTLWEVWQAALWAEQFSGGLVRPGVGGAVIQAGYDRSFDVVPSLQTGPSVMDPVFDPFSVVLADEQARTLCLPPGLKIDLGGVAKGWAADQAMRRLQALGCTRVFATASNLPGLCPSTELCILLQDACAFTKRGGFFAPFRHDGHHRVMRLRIDANAGGIRHPS